MEVDILDGKIGNVGEYDLEFKDKKLVFKVGVKGGMVENTTSVDAKLVLAALKKAIPGTVDDALIGALEAGLGL